jgi:hypothetical protein
MSEASTVLGRIATELDHARDRQDAVSTALGHEGLARQFREFTGNWGRHRRLLVEEITAVRKSVDSAMAAFGELDGALAQALVDARSASGGAAPVVVPRVSGSVVAQ